MPAQGTQPTQSTGRIVRTDVVVAALAGERRGMSLDDLRHRCDLSVAETSRVLVELEFQGRARYVAGRWRMPRRLSF